MGTVVAGRWWFGVLGPLEASVSGAPVRLGGERQRVLLALLLVHANALVTVEQLVEELFGEERSDSAVKAVQVAVSRLRRVLDAGDGVDGVLQSRPGGYVLRAGPGQLDTAVFERLLGEGRGLLASGQASGAAARLREALGLWRGPALADLAGVDCLQGEIRRLEELRLGAVMERVDADLALGSGAELISELESLVASEPLQERLRGQLMLALYRAGRRADALAVYRELSGLLRDELGLEPSTSLQELERSILQHDASLQARPEEAFATSLPSLAGHVRDSSAAAGELVEREAELAQVDRLLDRVGGGVGAVVVVEGVPGIGKTELLSAVAAGARARGFEVFSARGPEFEAEIAFGIARQVFEPMLRAASAGERRRLLGGVARVGGRALGVVAGEPPADRFAAIHGLFWLCANLAERAPLVVAVDDMQWADDPSLTWLGYLARRTGDLPLAMLLGLRSGEPNGERRELAQLVDDRGIERLVLGPLTADAVSVIVRAQLDEGAEESFCRAVSELSGGNPLLARELLAAAREQGFSASGDSVPGLLLIAPTAVGTSVLARLRRLGGEAVALARAVAVLGPAAEVVVAARLAELDPVVAELTADRLAAAQILAPSRPLEFFHPLIGAAVLQDIAPGARRVMHRRAAGLIEGGAGGSLARVAAHLLACGPAGDTWVVRRLRDAAEEALNRGAPEIAIGYVERALSEPPADDDRAALLLLLGSAEWRAGKSDAIAHLQQALAAAGDDLAKVIAACSLLAEAYNASDHAERAGESLEVLSRARAAVGDKDAMLGLVIDARSVASGILDDRTTPAALRRAEELRACVNELPDPPVQVLVVLAWYAARVDRSIEAQQLADRALAAGPYSMPLDISIVLIVTLMLIERYDPLLELSERLLAAARRRGALHELVAMTGLRGWASFDCGALADAEADARWALERTDGVFRMHAVTQLIRVLVERDELGAAAQELNQLANPGESHHVDVIRFLIARGSLRRAQGRFEEAIADFLESGRRRECFGGRHLSGAPWRGEAALVYAAVGETSEARRLAHEQLELARAFDRPRTLGISLRICGLVEGGETGLRLLAEAVKMLERAQSPLELARALADYGAELRHAGRRVQARVALERALDVADRCGARRIANQARAELIAAGAKARRGAITGRDTLTVGELRVARLAADGLTDREIAQALLITTNAAEAQLSRVHRKLEITHRDQLANALTRIVDDGGGDQTAIPTIA